MAAYFILDIDVHDSVGYEEYRQLAAPSITAYGGKYLVRGGKAEVMEGKWSPNRIVVVEFESVERALQWYNSPEYGKAKPIRHKAATTNGIIVEGM